MDCRLQSLINALGSSGKVLEIGSAWQCELPKLGVFDLILYRDSREALDRLEEGNIVLKKGKEALALAAELFPELTKVPYSDSEIDQFFNQAGRFHPREMAGFLFELKTNGQISESQYEKSLEKYGLERREKKGALQALVKGPDPVFPLLEACLKNHMLVGSRFACLSNHTISNYEDPQFFENIITHPNLNYREELTSENKLLIIVEKLGAYD